MDYEGSRGRQGDRPFRKVNVTRPNPTQERSLALDNLHKTLR